jgi:hypothetical protein
MFKQNGEDLYLGLRFDEVGDDGKQRGKYKNYTSLDILERDLFDKK